jgi:hypothetical protein
MPCYFASHPQETRTRKSPFQCSCASPTKRRVPMDMAGSRGGAAIQSSKQNAHRVTHNPTLAPPGCGVIEQFSNAIHKLAVRYLFKLLLHTARNIFDILHGRPPGCEMSFGSLSPFLSEHHRLNSPILSMCGNAAARSQRKVLRSSAWGATSLRSSVLSFSRTFFFRKSLTPCPSRDSSASVGCR